MILADTSAWVEYDRATGSTTDLRLSELIAADGPVAVTEPVIMEVLAGARSEARGAYLRRLLLRFHQCHFDATADFDGAVRIYRRCRKAGFIPGGWLTAWSPPWPGVMGRQSWRATLISIVSPALPVLGWMSPQRLDDAV